MVHVFSTTTSLLADEYVDSFPAEKLAVTLFKIAKNTGVELSKENKSFLIRGNWVSVNHAHSELQQYLNLEIEASRSADYCPYTVTEEVLVPADSKKLNMIKKPKKPENIEIKRGRKPGTTVDPLKISESNLPKPVVVLHGDLKSFERKTLNKLVKDNKGSCQINADQKDTQTTNSLYESNCCEKQKENKTSVHTSSTSLKNENSISSLSKVDIKKEPVDDLNDFGSDTDIDEQYLQDSGGEADDRKEHSILEMKSEKGSENEEIEQKTTKRQKKKDRKKKHKQFEDNSKKSVDVKPKTVIQANSDGQYECKECDYKGAKRSNLSEHRRRMHGKPVKCDICNKFFGLKKDLSRHKRQVHTEPSYYCEICGKLYKFRRAYNDHMKVHKENYVKPNFPCEICGKTFSTKYVLTGHVNSAHLGMSKTYVCPTCGRTFTQKNSYLMHANVHAGIKPFVCDVCGRYFKGCSCIHFFINFKK